LVLMPCDTENDVFLRGKVPATLTIRRSPGLSGNSSPIHFTTSLPDAKSEEKLNINSLPDLRGSLGGQVKKIVFS
ncbi:MAG: hypothetical protein SWN10_24865, partial [Pseudomonadota bacterium]|nr:hypothetical protein [Pseudomonadota bacterium]